VRKLSTRRRHPLAGIVVLVLGLVVAGGLYSAFAPKPATAETTTSQDVEVGRELYLVGCASCHGKNASGIETQSGGNYGPSLIGVGAAAVDFQVGTGRMPLAQTAPQAPPKEPQYTDEETRQLAAYIASLAPGPAVPDEEYTDISGKSDEEIAEGGEFFRTNCTACHNSVGAGGALGDGRYAPPITGVEPRHIYEAMLTGPQSMPVFNDELLTPEDKRNIIAYIEKIDSAPQYGGAGLGGFGPVSEGLVGWVGGIGILVAFAAWIGANTVKAKKKCATTTPLGPTERRATRTPCRPGRERRLPPGSNRTTTAIPSPTPAWKPTRRGRPTTTRRWRSGPSDRWRRSSRSPCC